MTTRLNLRRVDAMRELPRTILDCIGNTRLFDSAQCRSRERCSYPAQTGVREPNRQHEGPAGARHDPGGGAGWTSFPNGSVVEYTGGSTGVSLALVCAVKGYPLHIVTSDAFAQEKLDHMEILGAKLQIMRSDSGRMTEKLTRDMIEAARIIAAETGAFWTDQLKNEDQLAAYHGMAEEVWSQTDGRIDGFVQCVGTAASVRGNGETLRRYNERIRIVAVEPDKSAVLSGGQTGAHKIDGVGAGFVVPLWHKVSLIASSGFPRKGLRPWRFGWLAKKASLRGRPPVRTLSPGFVWPNSSRGGRPSSR